MKKLLASSLCALALTALAPPAPAQIRFIPPIDFVVTWKCRHWNLTACTSAEMANPAFKQVVVLSTGYQESERAAFWTDFDTFVGRMSNAGTTWPTTQRDKLLYFGYFTGGGDVGSDTATFGAKVAPDVLRGQVLGLSSRAVIERVEVIKNEIPSLKPLAVDVLFDDQTESAAARAISPALLQKTYGIARMNRIQLGNSYTPVHETSIAALGWGNESAEPGSKDLSLSSLDVLTPLLQLDGSWSGAFRATENLYGNFDLRLSDVLLAGHDNLASSSVPSLVGSPIGPATVFQFEAGLGFGRGVFHASGSNVMNNDVIVRGPNDTFAYAQSAPQQGYVDAVFNGVVPRANDRLRAIGPTHDWPLALGSTTHVSWYDGDKLNHAHPTTAYAVEVGWWERVWYTEWYGAFPYPTYKDVWKTAIKYVYPQRHTLTLQATAAYGLANVVQRTLCGRGLDEINGQKICEQPISSMPALNIPTYSLEVPYEETDVPATSWMTTYYWHVASYNARTPSNWTAWSSFYRSF